MRLAEDVKARATKLRELLSGLGHTLKHSECLEVISKVEGYPDWNTCTADINSNQQRAEGFLDEMLEGDADLDYEKFTQRFELKYLVDFSEREFKRNMRDIHEDLGGYVCREFMGCLNGDLNPDNATKYPNRLRYVWRGKFEKNEALMIMGVYSKDGTYFVSGFRYI